MITRKTHTREQVLMDEPSGSQSWVDSQFVGEKEAEGYTVAAEGSAPNVTPADFGDLSSKNKKALVSIGQELGLAVNMTMKKDELIIAIEGTQ